MTSNAAEPTGEVVEFPAYRSRPLDPPPLLREYRQQGGLSRLRYPDGHLGWLITDHALARSVLADRRFSAQAHLIRSPVVRPGAEPFIGQQALPGWFVDMDPPEHTRYRRHLARHFTMRRVLALRSQIEALADELLSAMEAGGSAADLVQAFALPLPSAVICGLLGVPRDDQELFQHNSEVLFKLDSSAEAGREAMALLTGYLLELVAGCHRGGGEGLLAALVAGGELSDQEIAGAGVLLLTAGHETISSSLALSALALLTREGYQPGNPPEISEAAVEELFRYLTVFHLGVPRTPHEDVELDGRLLRAGECVTISLPAANRDPERFRDPDALNLTRTGPSHLAFGYGIHQCLGQHLARLELTVGLQRLLTRLPGLQLATTVDRLRFGGGGIYGIDALPVHW